jgi:G:T-mismatch repair DNA endonuclease (very short patch repair protein)
MHSSSGGRASGRGFRYRLHDKNLPGCLDIVLKRHRTIVDVRGCLWHHGVCALPYRTLTPTFGTRVHGMRRQ